MNRLLKSIMVLLLVVCCTACSSKDTSSGGSYEKGIEYGMQKMFQNLYHASSNKKYLGSGEVWETPHFVLTFTDEMSEDGAYLKFNLTLKDITIEECFKENKMLFNIYSPCGDEWDMVLGYDNYYDYALFEKLEGYNGKGTIGLYKDVEELVSVIVIDGHMYTAVYFL